MRPSGVRRTQHRSRAVERTDTLTLHATSSPSHARGAAAGSRPGTGSTSSPSRRAAHRPDTATDPSSRYLPKRLVLHRQDKTQATGVRARYTDKRHGGRCEGVHPVRGADARRFAPMFKSRATRRPSPCGHRPCRQMGAERRSPARGTLPEGQARDSAPAENASYAVLRAGDFGGCRARAEGVMSASSARPAAGSKRAWRSNPHRRCSNTTPTTSARPIRCPSSTTSPRPASPSSSGRWRTGARS